MKTATFTLLAACATAMTATIPTSASVDDPAPTELRPVPIKIAPAPALVPIERAAQNHPEVERLIERLESQSDDGTLNSQDHLRIRMLRKRLAS